MDVGLEIMSRLITYSKYAKYKDELNRRETWDEIIDRYQNMMVNKYPNSASMIEKSIPFIRQKRVLPSMRALQFAGPAAEVNNSRIYNCCYLPIDSIYSFSESMFLLLGGTGVGYSVQRHHVAQLPPISKRKEKKTRTWLIEDSIMGWADAVKVLIKYHLNGGLRPKFDFRDIRPKGSRLITAGGKAPGPEPLRVCLAHIEFILDRKQEGEKLTPLECHDIMCHIANSVLAGGIRRSAMIALFSPDDEEMLTCKYGSWYELNEQRGRANNSAVLERGKVTEEEFFNLWRRIKASGSGEPGIYWTNNPDWGTNPSLRAGTRIITSDGVFPIEQLENKEFIVPNLNGQWSEAKCWKSGTDINLIEIKLDTGESYFSSPQHQWPVYLNGRYVKVTASELKSGDKLPLNTFDRESLFQREGVGNYGEGFLAGWIYGDGCITTRKDTGKKVVSIIASDKDNTIDTLLKIVNKIDNIDRKVYKRGKCNEFQVGSPEFLLWMEKFTINKKSEGLPKGIWTDWSEEMIRGFIDGLFSSDGHVPTDLHGVSLSSSHYSLIKDVQDLLGMYGIKSSLTKKIQKGVNFPNGYSDKEYITYSLRTTVQGRGKFSRLFSLSVEYKQSELEKSIPYKEEFITIKEAITTSLSEDVWDISVKDTTHCFHLPQVTTGNCCEIALRPYSFCNLCEINVNDIESQEDLIERTTMTTIFGTLQAGFTDFHYLRSIWQTNTQLDSLLGIGMTGIGSGNILQYDLKEAAEVAVKTNQVVSEMIGIPPAARVTCIKPSGTTSLVLGTSSGIHAWHNSYYLRTLRYGKDEEIAKYLMKNHPELCEDDVLRPSDTVCVRIPVKAPDNSILRSESPIDTLERVKKFSLEWIKPGHITGDNTHNVSATISVKDDEWDDVGQWMWENREVYNGLAVIPYHGGNYVQAPFEDITKEEYERRVEMLKSIDLTNVIETEDVVNFGQIAACSSGSCSID